MNPSNDNLEIRGDDLKPFFPPSGPPPFLVLDVREQYELGRGVLPGAQVIPMSQLEQRWPDLPRDRRIICYCEHGVRSLHVSAFLQQQGYDIVSLAGGFAAWDGPVEPAAPEAFS